MFRETIDAMRRFLLQDGWICSVIGAPGSGRTTQCRKLSEALKVANISWEELMKREIDRGNGAVLKWERMRLLKLLALSCIISYTSVGYKANKAMMCDRRADFR